MGFLVLCVAIQRKSKQTQKTRFSSEIEYLNFGFSKSPIKIKFYCELIAAIKLSHPLHFLEQIIVIKSRMKNKLFKIQLKSIKCLSFSRHHQHIISSFLRYSFNSILITFHFDVLIWKMLDVIFIIFKMGLVAKKIFEFVI